MHIKSTILTWKTIKFLIPMLEFQGGMARFVPKIQKSRQKESRGRESPALKNSQFPENFYFYETELPVFEKSANFRITLDNFLVSKLIFYCRSEVTVFRFYQELNAVRYENSELSRRTLRTLPVFGETTEYLHKKIVDLININCGKSSYSDNQSENS